MGSGIEIFRAYQHLAGPKLGVPQGLCRLAVIGVRQHLQAAGGKLKADGRYFQVKVDFEFTDKTARESMTAPAKSMFCTEG